MVWSQRNDRTMVSSARLVKERRDSLRQLEVGARAETSHPKRSLPELFPSVRRNGSLDGLRRGDLRELHETLGSLGSQKSNSTASRN